MKGVFNDLKFFFYFYAMVVMLFTLLFFNLKIGLDDSYATIGDFGYILMSFRTSLGDFSVDSFKE
jgi:hypothetical protein